MLKSGNGRHRRPRQASTAVVVVAVTGAGIALPLLGAGAAQAADVKVWDKVAACESGGLWSANAGNGFYGGLAITEDTWEQYGGTVYAPRPDLASRSQQIAVAETLLAELGPDAWPGCAEPAGLVTGGAPPAVDPGSILPSAPVAKPTTPTTAPTKPATPTVPTKPTKPPVSTTPTTPTTPSTPTGTPATDDPTTDPTTDPVTDPTADPTEGPGGSDATVPTTTPAAPTVTSDLADTTPGRSQGRHAKPESADSSDGTATDRASRDAERAAGATDTGDLNGAQNTGQGDVAADGDYVVVPGDNLCDIAADHHLDGGWKALYGANDRIVGDNPDLILPGQHLDLGY